MNALFLIDYELLGQQKNGLEVIQQLGIQDQSILVTSRYEEKEILAQCEILGVRMVPKPMAALAPIRIFGV